MIGPPGASRGVWLPPGLWRLLALRLRATRRETVRRLRTPAGVVLLALGVLVVGGFVLVRAFLPTPTSMPSEDLRVAATFFLAAVVVLQILTRGEGDVLGFTPAEADQLFGAPYRPHEVLRYKLTLMLVAVTSTSILSTPFFLVYGRRVDTTLVFALLVTAFIQLGSMVVAMALRGAGRLRRLGAGAVVVAALAWGWSAEVRLDDLERLRATGQAVLDHPVGTVLLAPAWAGASVLAASGWQEALPHAVLLLGIDVVLLGLLLRLGRGHWVELAADGAQHIGNVVERVRGGSLLAATRVSFVRLPQLPRWGGVGPLARRQLAEVLRRPATLLLLGAFAMFPQAFWLLVTLPPSTDSAAGARAATFLVGATAGLLAVGQAFVPSLLRTDFRGDLDRLDTLLALPVPRWALVAGQVLPGAFVLALLGLLTSAGLLVRTWATPTPALVLLCVQPFVGLWQITIENVVFLLLPHRIEMGEAAIEGIGKGLLAYILAQTLTWAVGIAALVLGMSAGLVVGPGLGVLAADGVLVLASLAAGAIGAARLARFDPGVHVR